MRTVAVHLQAWWVSRRGTWDERGANLVEYALLIVLVALVCFAAVTLLGETVSSKYESMGEGIQNEP
jgi:Flp pilus assembly pilin Flp